MKFPTNTKPLGRGVLVFVSVIVVTIIYGILFSRALFLWFVPDVALIFSEQIVSSVLCAAIMLSVMSTCTVLIADSLLSNFLGKRGQAK